MRQVEETRRDCGIARAVLDGPALDAAMEAHLAGCATCAEERRVRMAVRSAVRFEAPPELSARLMALAMPAPQPARIDVALKQALVVQAPPDLSRRLQQLVPGAAVAPPVQRRWVMPVYVATAVLLSVVLVLAGQMYGLALQQLGLGQLWQSLAQMPQTWLDQFYVLFPSGRYLVEAFFSVQRVLQWVLIGLLMWVVLDLRAKRPSFRGQPSQVLAGGGS